MSAPALALTSSKAQLGLLYSMLDQNIVGPLRAFFHEKPTQDSTELESQISEVQEIFATYKKSLEHIASSKSPEQAYKRIIDTLDATLEFNFLANEILLSLDENLIDSIEEGAESISETLDDEDGKLPPLYRALLLDAHLNFVEAYGKYIENLECFVKSLPAAQEEYGVSPTDNKEQILRKALQEFNQNKTTFKHEVEKVQKNPSVELFSSSERLLLVSSLAFQSAMFTSLEIQTGKIASPSLLVIDKIITETANFAVLYQRTSEDFWNNLFVELYFHKLSEVQHEITNLYIKGFTKVEHILVNVKRDIETDILFKIYDLETQLFSKMKHPPEVEVLFETDFIPDEFTLISDDANKQELQG